MQYETSLTISPRSRHERPAGSSTLCSRLPCAALAGRLRIWELAGATVMLGLLVLAADSIMEHKEVTAVTATHGDSAYNAQFSHGSSLPEACASAINMFPSKIDIVIPYRYHPEDPSLRYELRSFEANGLLQFVDTVFLLVDTDVNKRLTESMYKGVSVVSMYSLPIPQSNASHNLPSGVSMAEWTKMMVASRIPNIAEYFLFVPDDVVLLKKFTHDLWYNTNTSRPYAHSLGSFDCGETLGHPLLAPLHGPSFVNRCAMEWVIQRWSNSSAKHRPLDPISASLGEMHQHGLVARLFYYHDPDFREIAGAEFFSECHTNGFCIEPHGFDDVFVNVQGNGVSKEYPDDEQAASTFHEWFEDMFPRPSRFETVK